MAREHKKSGRDQVLTRPDRLGEPCTGDDSSTLGTDVIAALRLLTKMINQRSKLWPPGIEQGSPSKAELRIWSPVNIGHYIEHAFD
jgi:hypothetical protein